MRFARSKKDAVLLYLNDQKQTSYDAEHFKDWPETVGDEFGNNFRCLSCGAPPGKQCMKADGSFRNYPHQKRRDVAAAAERTK